MMNEFNCILEEGFNKAKLEEENVHQVYDMIYESFDSKRSGNLWEGPSKFINSLKEGSLVLDLGCGNGRYMNIRDDITLIGVDRCSKLMKLGKEKLKKKNLYCDFLEADALAIPFKDLTFDSCICIAMLHHLSTEERRKKVLMEICRCLADGGTAYIEVWKYENGKDFFESQDNLVDWKINEKKSSDPLVYKRYYHLFKFHELEELILSLNLNVIKICSSGEDGDNWYIIIKKKIN